MSLGAAFMSLFLAVGAILAGALFAFAAVAVAVALTLPVLVVGGWLSDRAYRRHRKWVDGLCQGEPPK